MTLFLNNFDIHRFIRWLIFFLSLFYWSLEFLLNDFSQFGWHFRFLTVWALTINFIIAFLMLDKSVSNKNILISSLVSSGLLLNVTVVYLYWQLYFTDPAMILGYYKIPLYRDLYVHLIGPFLQIYDAVFIFGAFRHIKETILTSLLIFILYVFWIEMIIQPLNVLPSGKITSGLPYPFLNDIELSRRIIFYLQSVFTVTAIIMLFFFIKNIVFRNR